jgi:ABC-type antimicrobial peptide transport system permease subunit
MLILPNIRSALEQLWANKMRSVLTVLGIVIAVASTITVVSVVRGFTAYVADFLQGLGTNACGSGPNGPEARRASAWAGSSWTWTTSRPSSASARPPVGLA